MEIHVSTIYATNPASGNKYPYIYRQMVSYQKRLVGTAKQGSSGVERAEVENTPGHLMVSKITSSYIGHGTGEALR